MKAARLHGNRDIRIDEIDPPGHLSPTQLRVRPLWCGICGTDLHEYLHGPLYVEPAGLPQIIGHEFSAVVAQVGRDVRGFLVGDRVAVLPHITCGQCHFCVRGRPGLCRNLRLTGFSDPSGGLVEETLVEATQCVFVPEGVSSEQAAVLEPLSTVVHGVERTMRAGDSVLVTGAGPMGQLAVMVAIAFGAGAVYVSEPNATRRAQAIELGASKVLDPALGAVEDEILDLTGGLGVDCSIECAGSQPALDTAVRGTRAGGVIGQVALHVGSRTVALDDWTLRDLTFAGVWSFNINDTPRILTLIAAGRLPVERLITSRIGLDDLVSEGIERLADADGDQVKILVNPGASSVAAP